MAASLTPLTPSPPVQLLLHDLVETRTAAILSKLCASSRNGTITAQEALSGIATITGLRSLLSDLDSKLQPPK